MDILAFDSCTTSRECSRFTLAESACRTPSPELGTPCCGKEGRRSVAEWEKSRAAQERAVRKGNLAFERSRQLRGLRTRKNKSTPDAKAWALKKRKATNTDKPTAQETARKKALLGTFGTIAELFAVANNRFNPHLFKRTGEVRIAPCCIQHATARSEGVLTSRQLRSLIQTLLIMGCRDICNPGPRHDKGKEHESADEAPALKKIVVVDHRARESQGPTTSSGKSSSSSGGKLKTHKMKKKMSPSAAEFVAMAAQEELNKQGPPPPSCTNCGGRHESADCDLPMKVTNHVLTGLKPTLDDLVKVARKGKVHQVDAPWFSYFADKRTTVHSVEYYVRAAPEGDCRLPSFKELPMARLPMEYGVVRISYPCFDAAHSLAEKLLVLAMVAVEHETVELVFSPSLLTEALATVSVSSQKEAYRASVVAKIARVSGRYPIPMNMYDAVIRNTADLACWLHDDRASVGCLNMLRPTWIQFPPAPLPQEPGAPSDPWLAHPRDVDDDYTTATWVMTSDVTLWGTVQGRSVSRRSIVNFWTSKALICACMIALALLISVDYLLDMLLDTLRSVWTVIFLLAWIVRLVNASAGTFLNLSWLESVASRLLSLIGFTTTLNPWKCLALKIGLAILLTLWSGVNSYVRLLTACMGFLQLVALLT